MALSIFRGKKMENNQIFTYPVQIKEYHLDTFGHVNNAVYLQLYEEARWDFITKNGYGLEVIKKLQKGPVILEVNVKYKKELKNRESIVIESKTSEIRGRIMTLSQVIKKEDGSIASEATFLVGFFDMIKRTLIAPEPAWLEAIGYKK